MNDMTPAAEHIECDEFGEHIWMPNDDGSEECPCGTSYFPPGHSEHD